MPYYGCVNGPVSFARLMAAMVLKDMDRCLNFCDDTIIFNHTLEQHKEDVDRVLERLNSYNLKINRDKCQWFQKEVKFLGFLVNGEGIHSNPKKIKVVKE